MMTRIECSMTVRFDPALRGWLDEITVEA